MWNLRGCIKTWYLSTWSKIMLSLFLLLSCSQVVSSLQTRSVIFYRCPWVWKHSWLRVNKWHLMFWFPFITFPFAFTFSHIPFMLHSFPFILLSCPFMFCLYVSKIHVGHRKLICSKRSGGYPPKRLFFSYSIIVLSFSYRFGGLCRLPSSGLHEHVHGYPQVFWLDLGIYDISRLPSGYVKIAIEAMANRKFVSFPTKSDDDVPCLC